MAESKKKIQSLRSLRKRADQAGVLDDRPVSSRRTLKNGVSRRRAQKDAILHGYEDQRSKRRMGKHSKLPWGDPPEGVSVTDFVGGEIVSSISAPKPR